MKLKYEDCADDKALDKLLEKLHLIGSKVIAVNRISRERLDMKPSSGYPEYDPGYRRVVTEYTTRVYYYA